MTLACDTGSIHCALLSSRDGPENTNLYVDQGDVQPICIWRIVYVDVTSIMKSIPYPITLQVLGVL